MNQVADESAAVIQPARRREWPIILLVVVVALAYVIRTGTIPIRGEEPRWAEVAREFVESGTWIVPREQGDVFLDRPPLHVWLIVAAHRITQSWDVWTLRLPSLAATLATTLLIYAYGRTFLSRFGALAAGLAFATMGEMFQTGRLAETDALFILLLSASLLVWHWGWMGGWPTTATWGIAYALVGLAMLTKGLQAPVYFAGTVGWYLWLTGNWRQLLRPAHWVGVGIGLLVVALWFVPLVHELGLDGVTSAVEKLSTYRLRWKTALALRHLLIFPAEVLGCTAPWSLFLGLYCAKGFRRSLTAIQPHVLFLTLGPLVAFPTCWFHPGGTTRYFTPLYPLLALLIGVAIERCAAADAASWLRAWWRGYFGLAAGVMSFAAGLAALVGMEVWQPGALAELPPQKALGYAGLFALFSVLAWSARAAQTMRQAGWGLTAIAGFMVASCAGFLTDLRLQRAVDAAAAMAELRARLPTDQPLVSFNHVAPLFRYYYGGQIAARPFPTSAADPFTGYFCYDWDHRSEPPQLPFAWERIGTFSLDRVRRERPRQYVVVGRRLTETPIAPASLD
ncbi:MAG: glycosyltransferase family 39 protein [Gemmataceae bacterium]|nr:glycosyltransferase family 39 protein [Gemmataceae bacterium]